LAPYRDDWGTPKWVLDAARELMEGEIHMDLASSDVANELVGAEVFFTRENPCPANPNPRGNVWCNPPGPSGSTHEFWNIWNRISPGTMLNPIGKAFLFFNIDHARKASSPHRICTGILLAKRVKYVGAPSANNYPSLLVVEGDVRDQARELGIGHCFLWG